MAKYACFDWNGRLVAQGFDNLKDAVKQALKSGCEVQDQNGDIVFSKWDGWNSDYPNIKEISFPVADGEMIENAKEFLEKTGMFHAWCLYVSGQFSDWIGKEWLHSDRWSATYDWVNGLEDVELPEHIIECLVEYWETNFLHIKVYEEPDAEEERGER